MIYAKTAGLTKEEWLYLRKQGLTGTDSGAICGLNPYVSPMDVYRDKTTDIYSNYDNEAMKQGRDLEDYVAKRFTEATGLKVRKHNVIYQSDEHPFMLANVDRMLVGENIGLECKTTSPYNADKWLNGNIPPHYLTQCLHYMAVTGAKCWYLAVLIYGRDFKYIKIERDEKAIRDLIKIEKLFWEQNIVPRIMPDPDGSKACDQVIAEFYTHADTNKSIILSGFNEQLKRRAEIMEMQERLEQEKRQIEQGIKLYMGDAELAENDNYKITWKNSVTNRLDSKQLKADMPDIYERYCKSSNQRRLLIKAFA